MILSNLSPDDILTCFAPVCSKWLDLAAYTIHRKNSYSLYAGTLEVHYEGRTCTLSSWDESLVLDDRIDTLVTQIYPTSRLILKNCLLDDGLSSIPSSIDSIVIAQRSATLTVSDALKNRYGFGFLRVEMTKTSYLCHTHGLMVALECSSAASQVFVKEVECLVDHFYSATETLVRRNVGLDIRNKMVRYKRWIIKLFQSFCAIHDGYMYPSKSNTILPKYLVEVYRHCFMGVAPSRWPKPFNLSIDYIDAISVKFSNHISDPDIKPSTSGIN